MDFWKRSCECAKVGGMGRKMTIILTKIKPGIRLALVEIVLHSLNYVVPGEFSCAQPTSGSGSFAKEALEILCLGCAGGGEGRSYFPIFQDFVLGLPTAKLHHSF